MSQRTISYRYFMSRIALAITITGLLSSNVSAQDTPQSHGSKSEATIALSYYKKADTARTAVAEIKAKNKNGKFIPAINTWVNFYAVQNKEPKLINSTVTNSKGKAVIVLPKEMPLDDSLWFTIVAKIEKDSLYEDATEQVHFKDASLGVTLNPKDTNRIVTAKVLQMGKDGKEVPAKDVAVKFYVQRLFGVMPALEENSVNTDENGEASFTLPKNIPGDTAGTLGVVVKIEDNDKFGNVEKNATTSWGSRLSLIKDPFPRALWEPYAPMPLVITISTLFGGVWFTYFLIFFQLRKIKTSPDDDEDKTVKKN